MTIVDERGRLFGRLNLIDLAAAVLVLVLVPLAYGSWMLFRTRPPVIESVTPATLTAGQATQHLEVRGRHLRPFLRAWVGTVKAGYLFESADRAEIQVPALPPGTYDLAFFDSKELARFPNAVTVRPSPAEKLEEVDFLVRVITRPEILEEVSRSLRDRPAGQPHPTSSRPVLVSYEVVDKISGSTTSDLLQGRLVVIHCLVRALLAPRTADGWQHDGRALKAGAVFVVTGETYQLQGEVLKFTGAHGAQ